MADALRTLAALCITEGLFELLLPDTGMKRQLRTVSGLMVTAQTAKIILSFFGR